MVNLQCWDGRWVSIIEVRVLKCSLSIYKPILYIYIYIYIYIFEIPILYYYLIMYIYIFIILLFMI